MEPGTPQGTVNQLNVASGVVGGLSLDNLIPPPEALKAVMEATHEFLKTETARAKSEVEHNRVGAHRIQYSIEFEFMDKFDISAIKLVSISVIIPHGYLQFNIFNSIYLSIYSI